MEGKKEKKIVQNSKRNDLRDGRNRVAGYYDMNDIKAFHHVDVIEGKKYDREKHVIKKYTTLVEHKSCLKDHFIHFWVIAIYLNEANLIQLKKQSM